MNGYQYEAVFTNAVGSGDHPAATLTVQTAPTRDHEPDRTRRSWRAARQRFTAAASGNPAPTVQWEVNTGSGFTNLDRRRHL